MGDRRIARFEQLYREHFDFVWGTARSLGVGDAVPDVVQEVFITAYRRLDSLDAQLSPRGWLYAVTRRTVHRVRRTAARTARRELALRHVSDAREGPHAQGDAAADLARLLAQLDENQREVFVMADVLGMSGPEMAAQTGVPLDTVYSRLRLARGRLQRIARAGSLERAIDHARTPPAVAQSRRIWSALVVALPRASGPLGRLAELGLFKLALATGAAAFVAVVAATRVEDVPASAPTIAAALEPTPVPSTPASSIASPPIVAPAPIVVPAPVGPTPRERPRHAVDRADAPALGIDAELVVLERARARLLADDPAAALALIEGAPAGDSGLADARGSLRVRALCELGRGDDARAELARLRAVHPGSHVLQRTICAGA